MWRQKEGLDYALALAILAVVTQATKKGHNMFNDTEFDYLVEFYCDEEGCSLEEAERRAAKELSDEERYNDYVTNAYAQGYDPFENDIDDPFYGEY